MPQKALSFYASLRPDALFDSPKSVWRRHLWWFVALCLIAGAVDAATVWAQRPWPAPYAVAHVAPVRQAPLPLAWPAVGSAAVGAVGYGVLAVTGTDTPRPTASTAKLITALTVLERYPLALGQSGPTLTLTPADVTIYQQYYALAGSEVLVAAGEQLSEYQALEAVLVPSADNMADTLAAWAYGSIPNYLVAANRLVAGLGMTQTVVAGDASGLLPTTTSTPANLVVLGQAAMANPVIAQIVAEKSVTLPVAGTVWNYNALLGVDGIDGIKTGNTDQAGGVFIFTATQTVGAASVRIIGVVMGAATVAQAFADTTALLASARANFVVATPIRAGQVVGTYHVAWQHPVTVIADHSVSVINWRGMPMQADISLRRVHPAERAGTSVGHLVVTSGPQSAFTQVSLRGEVEPKPHWYQGFFRGR
jgi:D-alanyl-D-alanine carboxypeptidase (penicillin-binding protein 5/6)